jgi:hypothetical protein
MRSNFAAGCIKVTTQASFTANEWSSPQRISSLIRLITIGPYLRQAGLSFAFLSNGWVSAMAGDFKEWA